MSIKQKATQLAELAGAGIYASYKIANAIDLARWSKKVAGTKGKPEDPRELHCTSCYSPKPFDATVVQTPNRIKLGPNKRRRLGRLGDGGAVVLFFADDEQTELQTAWKAFMDAGADWGFPSYIPHVTIAYDSELTNENLEAMDAYDGPIMLHNLTIEPLKQKPETAAAPIKLKLKQVVRARNPKTGKLQNGTVVKIGVTKAKIAWDDGAIDRLVAFEDIKALTPAQLAKRKASLSKTAKTPATKKVATPKTGTATTKAAVIKEVKAWIKEYEKTNSDAKAEKLKKKIYDTLEKHQIKREEVGLKPIKVTKPKATPIPKKAPVAKTKRSVAIPSLTENEEKMLLSLYNNDYGYHGDSIWSGSHNDSTTPHNLPKTTASGVIASLVKKGLMHSDNVGPTKDHTCGLTSKGTDVANSLNELRKKAIAEKPIAKPTPAPKTSRLVKEVETPVGSISKFGTKLLDTMFKDANGGSKVHKLRFMNALWDHLNKVKFEGKMTIPSINLQKAVKVDRMRRRGVWYQESRRLEMSPHIFNNADKFYEIFLHEMCHQAVSEITRFRAREPNQGHGPIWQSWMVKVGLNPNRFDYGGNEQYMTEEQKATKAIQKEVKQKAVAVEKHTYPAEGKVAKWLDAKTGAWHEGVIVCPNDKAGKRWAFAKFPSFDVRANWSVIPSDWFYEVPVERHAKISEQLRERVQLIRTETLKKQQRRSNARSKGGNWDDADDFYSQLKKLIR